MPRIPPHLLRTTHTTDPALARLLPICRDIRSAQNELRWLREHAYKNTRTATLNQQRRLADDLVRRRAQGEPLQYILGSEFFGDLEIKCRPGVLIPRFVHCFILRLAISSDYFCCPRQDTASSVSHLVQILCRLKAQSLLPGKLRVLDVCAGSGCIPLLFWHDFYQGLVENAAVSLDIVGVDISDRALNLARENKAIQLRNLLRTGHNDSSQLQALQQMQFLKADVLHNTISHTPSLMQALSTHTQVTNPKFDILISNPPYISSRTYSRTTSPSVRSWEPKLALVPPSSRNKSTDGDIFYPPLLRAAAALEAQVMLLEVADMEQAIRVAAMVVEQDRWACVQIWRDGPNGAEEVDVGVRGKKVSVFGTGNGRSVFAHRGKGRDWSG